MYIHISLNFRDLLAKLLLDFFNVLNIIINILRLYEKNCLHFYSLLYRFHQEN